MAVAGVDVGDADLRPFFRDADPFALDGRLLAVSEVALCALSGKTDVAQTLMLASSYTDASSPVDGPAIGRSSWCSLTRSFSLSPPSRQLAPIASTATRQKCVPSRVESHAS